MTFSEFLAAVRCYWLTFAVMVAVVFGSALAWLLLARDQYVSTAQVLVSLQGSTTAEIYQSDDAIQSRINSYIALLSTDVVSQRVVDKLGLQMPAHDLASRISAVKVPPNTALIDIAVTDHSPERARQLTQTVAEEFVGYANALETPSGEGAQKVQSSVVTAAGEAHGQRAERILLGAFAAVLALMAGSVVVWVRATLGKRRPPPGGTEPDPADAPAGGAVPGDHINPENVRMSRRPTDSPTPTTATSRGRRRYSSEGNSDNGSV